MSELADTLERTAAIDPHHSVCVSAPAGSGKTELLIQRYLNLLSRVQRPEQVLAITFTRKAAAEMRERVLESLRSAQENMPCDNPHQQVTRTLAEQALAADARGEWQLLGNISRFNIKTIDSFCAGLTRQMPVLSQFGGQANVKDDVTPLYIEAVQELYKLLEGDHPIATDLRTLLQHFDNDWERLQTLLVSMLARRDQWRGYIGVHHAPEEAENYLVATVGAMVSNELSDVDQKLAVFRGELLQLMQFSAANLNEPPPLHFPQAAANELAHWRTLRDLLLTKSGHWRKKITKAEGFPAGTGEPQRRKKQWQALLLELQTIEGLQEALASVQSLPALEADSDSWRLVLHLSRLLPTLAAQLLLVFQQQGVVDHCQVAQSALLALGDDDAPTELALRLDYQIDHILVDEFQDTAITQYELLQKLTRGWGEYNEQNPEVPRTLMIVGDGMQSIYGFRGANVGLFLKARSEGFNSVVPRYLELSCNFRSDRGVVDWVNNTFESAFPSTNDVGRAQVRFSRAQAVRPLRIDPAVQMRAFSGGDARRREVLFVCDQIAECIANSEETIAILGRTRSHLQPIVKQLKYLGIPYNAPDLDGLAQSPAVADLLTLCRALYSDADRLAWMAVLRAPWCGLRLEDLLAIARAGDHAPYTPIWSVIQQVDVRSALSEDGRSRLQHVLPALQRAREKHDRLSLRVWVEQAWVEIGGPQCAPDEDSLLDVENFLQLLEEAESAGVGFDLDWLTQSVQKRFMNARDPDSKVHLLTLHKAKGLEFDRVIIPQLDRSPRRDDRDLLLWDEYSNADGERSFLLAADDHSKADTPTLYNYLQLQRQKKTLLEATRLLYVGATRAIAQLFLTGVIKTDTATGLPNAPSRLSLLNPIWPAFSQEMQVYAQRDEPASAPALRTPRHLTRLAEAAVPVPANHGFSVPRESADNPTAFIANSVDRSIGNVVHKVLETLSHRDILPEEVSERDLRHWHIALQREGLRGEALNRALASVRNAVANSIKVGGAGRWVLCGKHREAHSEWALTTVDSQQRIRDIVIDRSFVDADTGVRWVIDYKSSCPGPGESIEAFFSRESAVYHEQLRAYRDAVRFLGQQPMRCALFFTALGQLHIIETLDLPGL
ncbi:ATP-dependent helicase/nuclease subunit A [Halioglobus japonicus]|nr:ATP-dependent helicase/nuclease subunit A [Halioglobus japonicus]